jgi:hypothetical protein
VAAQPARELHDLARWPHPPRPTGETRQCLPRIRIRDGGADGAELDINTRTRNALLRSLRCLGERGFALLTQRWRTLQHVTVSPSKISKIAQAALVLTHFEHGYLPC